MTVLERLASALNRLPPVTSIENGVITVGESDGFYRRMSFDLGGERRGGLSRCRMLAAVLACAAVSA